MEGASLKAISGFLFLQEMFIAVFQGLQHSQCACSALFSGEAYPWELGKRDSYQKLEK